MNHWIQEGAAREKLVAGIPFYGRTFISESPDKIYMGAPNVAIGPAGRFTQERGFMSYYEVTFNYYKLPQRPHRRKT